MAEVDVQSFDDFYRERYGSALRLAIALTGSPPAAEDLVQDVMAAAHQRWGRIGRYDEPGASSSQNTACRLGASAASTRAAGGASRS